VPFFSPRLDLILWWEFQSLACRSPACRIDQKLHPTDWLKALPQSTLVELMQRRCQYMTAAAVRSSKMNSSETIYGLKASTTVEVTQLENQIFA
jgi:hypothetical protein